MNCPASFSDKSSSHSPTYVSVKEYTLLIHQCYRYN